MSIFNKIGSLAKKVISSPIVRAASPILGGPIGVALTTASTAYGAYQALKTPAAGAVLPGAGSVTAFPSMPSLSAGMMSSLSLGGLGAGAVMGAGRAVIAGGRSVARSAANLCRKYPQWCTTIGGTAAIEALMHSGQLPVQKRRRGRGITATELRNFKRVARFTSKYCAPVRKAMKAPAMRRGSRTCQ